MRNALLLFSAFACISLCRAEYLFGSRTSTNRLSIPTNQAIIISAVAGGIEPDPPFEPRIYDYVRAQFFSGGATNEFTLHADSDSPLVLAGPLEIAIAPDAAVTNDTVMVSFKRLQMSAARTKIIPEGTNLVITVASNQSLHFLPLSELFLRPFKHQINRETSQSKYAEIRNLMGQQLSASRPFTMIPGQ